MALLRQCLYELRVQRHEWKPGDDVVLDNIFRCHGPAPEILFVPELFDPVSAKDKASQPT